MCLKNRNKKPLAAFNLHTAKGFIIWIYSHKPRGILFVLFQNQKLIFIKPKQKNKKIPAGTPIPTGKMEVMLICTTLSRFIIA